MRQDDPSLPSHGNADNLLPTLLDRLTDHAPQRQNDTLSEIVVSRKQLRQIILRDLSWLLNATNADSDAAFQEFPQVRRSTLNYGLPAFSGKRASDVKLGELEDEMRSAIALFEPRVMTSTLAVRAIVSSDNEAAHNTVVFEIRGQIWAYPYPIEMLLKSSIDLETGSVSLLDQLGDN
ncbi:type VI secretion system baseplate subunit TssE [Comamonas sp. MYb69]|uniref:type VI secretion system baseplate subunit TssE n=1 Tax=Comamonas sp. MYb69 TaxID=1848650 RepID=UPI0030A6090A